MLNIEFIRFEAQDVITASKAASVPMTPLQPACTCYTDYPVCEMNGFHIDANGEDCPATNHVCGY